MARNILNGLVALLLVGAFVFPYWGGAVTAYVLIALSLILIIVNLVSPTRAEHDPGAWMFLLAWVMIGVAFAITNRPGTTDVLLATNFAMFALYPMLAGALRRFAGPSALARVAVLALIGAIGSLGLGAFQVFVQGMERAWGFGSNPIPSGTVAMLLGFFSLAGLFAIKDGRRYLFLLGPIAGVATVFLSQSRGPLIGLPALVLIALLMVPIRRAVLVGAVAAVIVAGGAAYVVKPELFGRIASLPGMAMEMLTGAPVSAETDESGNVRYRIYEGSVEAFTHSPWVGYGWYAKVPVVEKYIEDPVGFGDPTYAHLHSDIANFGVAAGVVGLLAYLLVLLAPIAGVLHSPRDGQYKGRLFLALSLSATYLCCGAVNLLFGFEFMTTMFVVLAAVFVAYCRDVPAPLARDA